MTLEIQIARSVKDSRVIPNLIYAIEQFERYLILLSKKSKVKLMSHVKQSLARDFRIIPQKLNEALVSDEEEEEQEANDLLEEEVDKCFSFLYVFMSAKGCREWKTISWFS